MHVKQFNDAFGARRCTTAFPHAVSRWTVALSLAYMPCAQRRTAVLVSLEGACLCDRCILAYMLTGDHREVGFMRHVASSEGEDDK
jgi:hypothetical protein